MSVYPIHLPGNARYFKKAPIQDWDLSSNYG